MNAATRAAALAALALEACSSAQPIAAPSGGTPAWRVRESGGMTAIDPGAPAASDLLDARGCAGCHAAIYAEWATSRHARAWTNGIFAREFREHREPWCINCHAPLTTQQAELARAGDGAGAHPRADQGVDCATCHVRAGQIVSAKRHAGSPHATTVDPSFGSPAFCADCHQFTFPSLDDRGRALAMTAHPMQTTVASFASGPYASQDGGCMGCHGSRANHAFAGGHDPGMLDASLAVDACRGGADGDRVRLTVKNVAAGHTVPTGDIHRHMSLRLWRSSAPEHMYEAFIGRRFEPADDGGKTTSWDSTIPPGGQRTFEASLSALAGDADEPLNLELVYIFLLSETPRDLVGDAPTATLIRRAAPVSQWPRCAAST